MSEIDQLHGEGLTYREIAAELGISYRQVRKALSPGFAEKERATNLRRNAAKRAWEDANDRPSCSRCGGVMGVGAHRFGRNICRDCVEADLADRRARMVQMRRVGLSNPEIARELNTTTAAVAQILSRESKADPTIPRGPYKRLGAAA